MKKIYLLCLVLSSVSIAEGIKYETLDEEKKYVIDTSDKLRDLQIKSINYELSNFNVSSEKTSGENFLESIEDENSKYEIGNNTYFIGNKDEYNINTKFNFGKVFDFEGNNATLGLNMGYVNGKINNNKLNGVNVGIYAKSYMPDYKLKINTEHKFNYTNVEYEKAFKQNYLGVYGGIDIRTSLGSTFFVEPGVRASYTFNLDSNVLDQNEDKIELKKGINASIGGLARIGYIFGKENKFKLSLGYSLDKRLNNLNKYNIFNKNVEKPANNYITHDVDMQFDVNLKEKHKFSLSVGKNTGGYKGGLSYNYIW